LDSQAPKKDIAPTPPSDGGDPFGCQAAAEFSHRHRVLVLSIRMFG
jgi:hypothetical protein